MSNIVLSPCCKAGLIFPEEEDHDDEMVCGECGQAFDVSDYHLWLYEQTHHEVEDYDTGRIFIVESAPDDGGDNANEPDPTLPSDPDSTGTSNAFDDYAEDVERTRQASESDPDDYPDDGDGGSIGCPPTDEAHLYERTPHGWKRKAGKSLFARAHANQPNLLSTEEIALEEIRVEKEQSHADDANDHRGEVWSL